MKIVAMALVSVFLSGCSISYSRTHVPPAPTQMDMGRFSQKVHFIELMEFVRDNHHAAPTPQIKEKVLRLVFEAGLTQQCANRKCWLAYGDLKITTEELFINIEYRDKYVIKIDINEPDRAAKVIYG